MQLGGSLYSTCLHIYKFANTTSQYIFYNFRLQMWPHLCYLIIIEINSEFKKRAKTETTIPWSYTFIMATSQNTEEVEAKKTDRECGC